MICVCICQGGSNSTLKIYASHCNEIRSEKRGWIRQGSLRGCGQRSVFQFLACSWTHGLSFVLAADWGVALSPCHMGSFVGSAHNMAAYFFEARKTEMLSKADVAILCNIIVQLTFHRLCHILLGRSKSQVPPTLKGKRSRKRRNTAADPSLSAVANVAILV